MTAWNSFSYICTRALHSFRSFAHCRAASTVIPLLPKATFTPFIQPNLGLPRTRPPLTSAINTFLAIRNSFIIYTCPNHLNTLRSALLANSLSLPAHLRTSSFLTLSIRDTPTKLLKHFISKTSLSFSQHFSYSMPLLPTSTLVQLLCHIDTSWPLYCSAHFSALPTLYTPYSVCVPHPFHILHQLPRAIPCRYLRQSASSNGSLLNTFQWN